MRSIRIHSLEAANSLGIVIFTDYDDSQLTTIPICVKVYVMYVCICNGHRDRDIRDAAKTGLRCAREIYRHLGKPARCGRCLDFAAQLIEEVHSAAKPATLAPTS